MPSSKVLPPAIELPNRALDVYEVADVLDVCAATVRREASRGRLRRAGSAGAGRCST